MLKCKEWTGVTKAAGYLMAVMLCVTLPDISNSQEMESVSQDSVPSSVIASVSKKSFTEKLEYFDDGKVMSRSEFTLEGKLAGRRYYYHDGNVRKEELYDQAGNKIEESNYDDDGRLDDNFDGWAAKKWLYKDGMLRVESTYGEDGHLTERKIYNDLGDLVERQYVGDGKIDPNEEFNRGSIVTHETDNFYDRYGRQT